MTFPDSGIAPDSSGPLALGLGAAADQFIAAKAAEGASPKTFAVHRKALQPTCRSGGALSGDGGLGLEPLPQFVEHAAGAVLADLRVVEAVEEGAVLGVGQLAAGATVGPAESTGSCADFAARDVLLRTVQSRARYYERRTMSRRRSVAFIPMAVGALLGALGAVSVSAAPPVGTDASEVSHWNQVAATTLVAFPGPNGGAPPAFQINMGMVQGAVYDAVNAIGPKQHRPYLLKKRAGAKASIDAAVATAAYDVLSKLVSTAPERAPFPGRAGLLSKLSSEYAASLHAINDGAFKKQGISVGHAAAKAMLDARVGDGRFGPSQWVPDSRAGHWQPLLNAMGQPILDPTPWVGGVKPFLIRSSSQFRSVPPPALDSPQWAAEFNEVKSLGRATGSTRTDEQTYIARWWQSAPVLSWNEVARQLIARNHLDAADSARLLALQNLSGADAAINCWNDKYHFDFWRPWNAITTTLDDGNAATTTDPTWAALITAPYPEWVSGHNCLDSAHVAVLRLFFGDAPGSFQITSTFVNPGGPAVRTFDTFSQPMAELIEARIWAGLHYRSADVQGQVLGGNIARYGIANYFQPVGH
jgi:hypothetical protein